MMLCYSVGICVGTLLLFYLNFYLKTIFDDFELNYSEENKGGRKKCLPKNPLK